MKRPLLVMAVGAVFSVPAMADTTLYGNFRGSFNTGDLNAATAGDVAFVNNASRLGIKGASGSGGLKGIYHLQMGANNDAGGAALSSRFYFMGLKGGFGKVILGRLSTPYKMAGVKQDPFYDTSAGPANGGSNYGYSSLNNGFTDNTIAYYSPKIGGGLSIHASISIDDAATDDHDYGVGVEWGNKTSKIGVSYLQLDATPVIGANGGAESAVRLYGSTKIGGIGIGASYESVDTGAADNITFMHLNGSYKASPALKLALAYGKVSDGAAGAGRNSTGDGISVGAFYNILKNTSVSLIYSNTDYDDNTVADRKGVALGFVQKF